MSPITGHGLSIDPPPGWDVRIYLREGDDPSTARQDVSTEGTANPVLHLATVPLTAGRGDYGSGVVEVLGDVDAFVALVEFDPDAAGSALFSATPVPRRVDEADLQPNRLQRVIAGQAGAQLFAQESGRAFCLYVVAGSQQMRKVVADRVTTALTSLEISAVDPRPTEAPEASAGPQGDI